MEEALQDVNEALGSVVAPEPASPPPRRRWGVPPAAIALVLTAIVLLPDWFHLLNWGPFHAAPILLSLALFLPGALRRWRFLHVLAMLGATVLVMAGQWALAWAHVFPRSGYQAHLWLVDEAWPLVVLGLCEMLLTRRASWRAAAWVVLAALAAAALLSITYHLAWLQDWQWKRQLSAYSYTWVDVAEQLRLLLRPLLAWILLPSALRASPSSSRAPKIAFGGALVGCLAGFAAFYLWALPAIAGHMLKHGEWSKGQRPVAVLAARGWPQDMRILREALEASDWDQTVHRADEDLRGDWRLGAFASLSSNDPEGTAAWASALLLRRPSGPLAEAAAPVLAAQKRYETAAILMRFALVEDNSWKQAPQDALCEMRVPQVAYAILIEAASWDRPDQTPPGADFTISEDRASRLAQLFDQDAGLSWSAWYRLYDERMPRIHTPLTDKQQLDVSRTIDAVQHFYATFDQWIRFRDQLQRRKLIEAGLLDAVLDAQRRYRDLLGMGVGKDRLGLFATGEEKELVSQFEKLRQEATDEMHVELPDWALPTTDALLAEIDAYAHRVWKAAEDEGLLSDDGPPATPPATTRSMTWPAPITASRPSAAAASSASRPLLH